MKNKNEISDNGHDAGYIKLFRSLESNPVFENANALKVFIWCLMRATYTPREVRFHGDTISLLPGQFISGRFAGARACNMSPSTFRNQIHFLRTMQILDSEADNKKTIFTVINWARYQGEGSPEDSKEDNERTTKGHKQEGKKERKRYTVDTLELHIPGNGVDHAIGSSSEMDSGNGAGSKHLAIRIYEHYATRVRVGARVDAIRNIARLLKSHSPEDLNACIDRYAGNGMPKDSQYRIQANNFFGKAARFQDYMPEGAGAAMLTDDAQAEPALTETQRYFLKLENESGTK